MLGLSFQLMLYGLLGVFFSLGVLFALIKVITKLFPPESK
jgi:hypothetical protein